jgi:hypothetical protein
LCTSAECRFKYSNDLKNKIEGIGHDFKKYVVLKEDAYVKLKKFYSWDKITEDYISLFN